MRHAAALAALAVALAACASPSPPPAAGEGAAADDHRAERTGTVAVIRPLGGASAEVLVRDDAGSLFAVVLREASGLRVGDRVRLEGGTLRPAP
ncbi:MAG: hypothetical protein NZ523_01905 [Elioraea sp.]|nr:hypothetical protein [Elioraea sp.]